jgi:hypothetical protein
MSTIFALPNYIIRVPRDGQTNTRTRPSHHPTSQCQRIRMRQRSGVSAATWPCLLTPPLPSPRTRPPHLARASQTLCVLAVLAVAAAYSPGTVTFRAKPVSRGGSSSMVSPNVDQLVVLSKVWPTLLGAGTVVFWGGITTQRINSLQEGSVQVDKKIDDLKAKQAELRTDIEVLKEGQKQLFNSIARLQVSP